MESTEAQKTIPTEEQKAILQAGGHAPRAKARRITDPADWTPEKIRERAAGLQSDKGPQGNFED